MDLVLECQRREQLVTEHNEYTDSLKDEMRRLDRETHKITSVSSTELVRRGTHAQGWRSVEPRKDFSKVEETGHPTASPSHASLLQSLEHQERPFVKLLHTSDKIRIRNFTFSQKMDKILDRVFLDRNMMIRDKISHILGSARHDSLNTSLHS